MPTALTAEERHAGDTEWSRQGEAHMSERAQIGLPAAQGIAPRAIARSPAGTSGAGELPAAAFRRGPEGWVNSGAPAALAT
jgi:hypothetical protein